MVQVDASGSGGLVDPGVACWVGISGALGAREERGMSAWQFAVMNVARARASMEAFSALSIRGENGMTWRGDAGHTAASWPACLVISHSGHVAGPCSSGLGSDVPV